MAYFDFFNHDTKIAVISGYFRRSGYLDYNVKLDDLILIVNKYLKTKTIKFGENITTINSQTYKHCVIDALNDKFIIAINKGISGGDSSNLLSFKLYIFNGIFSI